MVKMSDKKIFNDLNKAEWKPKYLSEFSMGSLDFERYNKWLQHCERWSAEINSTANPTLEMIQHYFAGLNVLWKLWRPIVSSKLKSETVDNAIEYTKKLKRTWESSARKGTAFSRKYKNDIVDALDSIHTKLMEIKQIVGLGIVIRKNLGTREKIKVGMQSGGYGGNLPEP